jgi:hypothetical protein
VLSELRIRGLGVIDEAVVPFGPGLTARGASAPSFVFASADVTVASSPGGWAAAATDTG